MFGDRKQRGGARLVEQPRTAVRIGLERGGKKLQRNRTAEPDVLGEIHLAHPPGAKPLPDAVMLNGAADHEFEPEN